MSRRRWVVDPWAEWSDSDPAIERMRDITAPGRADAPGVAARTARDDTVAPDGATRRSRIVALVRRIENGDLSAVSTLRELLLER